MLCPAAGIEHSKKVRELLYRRVLRAWRHNTKLTSHNHDGRYPTNYGYTTIKLRPGSKILQANANVMSQLLISFDDLKDMFGVDNIDADCSCVLVSNGDWVAVKCQVTSFCYSNGWHVRYGEQISGNIRINYLALYFA